MKVRTAILLFAALIFGLFLLLGVSLIKMTTLLDSEAKNLAIAAESIRVAKEMKSDLLIHNRNAFFYTLYQDPARMATRNMLRNRIEELMATMDELANSAEEKSVLADLRADVATYLKNRDRLEASKLSTIEKYREISRDLDITLGVVDKLIDVNRSQMKLLTETIDRQNKTASRLGLLLLVIGGVVLLSLIGMIFLYIAHPLRTVAETISTFGSRNSSVRATPGGLQEIRQIADNFNSLTALLEEKRTEQLRFIAAIAHDLRNPLSSMSMASELLVRKCDPENSKWADVILRQVKNLDRMVGDLLDTTRIESGHIDLRLSVHNVNALIEDSVRLHGAASRLHRFNLEIPDQPLLCRCDAGRVFQVINNLLSNAIKYSPNGGTVTVGARREQDEIVISVADEGIGIAPGDFENIFTPFLRTSATRDTIPGIGLGLSASRHIVESHGGRMSVRSKPGTGSTFYFTLPAGTAETTARDRPRNAVPPVGMEKASSAPGRRMDI